MKEEVLEEEKNERKPGVEINYHLLIADGSTVARKLLIKQLGELLPEAEAVGVSNGRDAQEKLDEAPYDLVISELDLPRLDGFKLLEWIREQPKMRMLPFIVYTSNAAIENIKRTIKLGATDFILKPVTTEVLTRKIHENIEKVRALVKSKQEFARSISIPVKPQVLTKLNEEVNKPEPDLKKIVAIIDGDPSLCAKVIKTANSPFFGTGGVSSAERALVTLGLKEFKNTVLISLLQKELSGQRPLPEKFWTHSLLTAAAARDIAEFKFSEFGIPSKSPARQKEFVNNAYLAGLFHDCGMPLMLQKFDEYDAAAEINNTEFSTETEQARFFAAHASLGATMVRSWGIPDIVCDAIRHHHSPDIPTTSGDDPVEARLLWALIVLTDYMVRIYATDEPCRYDCDSLFAQSYGKALSDLNISVKALPALKLYVTELLIKIESRQ
jgi:putative nucleotidyltransferase with HDIG domain